jgi:hypothetical protein
MVGKLPALRFSGNLIRRSVSSDNTREYALERKPAENLLCWLNRMLPLSAV